MMIKSKSNNRVPKFTKGEKFIFTHLVVTFVIIFILFIIYVIHLYIVSHTQYGIFNTRRSVVDKKSSSGSENLLVGYLYLNMSTTKFLCNTLLLTPQWSLCTAHCVTARTDPDTAHLLFAWRVKYNVVIKDVTDEILGLQRAIFVTSIRRSIAHSLFSRETFANNVGLLEHVELYPRPLPNFSQAALILKTEDRGNAVIVGYNHSETEFTDNDNFESISYEVNYVDTENCSDMLSPVTVMRNYEFCVTLQKSPQVFLDYGAVMFSNLKVMGIFSWGERKQKEFPMVMINVTIFQDWLKTIVAF